MGILTSRTSRLEAELQARLQLREPRRDAYAEFIRASRAVQNALYVAHDQHLDGADARVMATAINDHEEAVIAAYSRVALEGPDSVVLAADAVIAAESVIWRSARAHSDAGLDPNEEPLGLHAVGDLASRIRDFITAARKAVDISS
ncbi:hypothetical protein [Streptomyces sp. NRRL F-2890]|jgi:hypothetical protein|uniref:hypothetical protein n=1 Tax=Streptomyces sp. NRRL F-2890 TaxID=1463845 RepID=UPI00131A5826|nr:hypothetical protein [Streptomyces sp. NRRL F-2890]